MPEKVSIDVIPNIRDAVFDLVSRYARRKLFYLKRPEQLDLYATGLTIAGMPDS